MDLRLDGKTALVTGGSRGIGRGIAAAFAASGAKVMIASRKADSCEEAAAAIGHDCQWYAANVGHADQAEALVDHTLEQFGAIDILVNNAGANPYAGPTIDVDVPRWEKTIQVNMTAPLVLTQLCWNKYMKDGPGGSTIINISSVGGLSTNEQLGVYDVATLGLLRFLPLAADSALVAATGASPLGASVKFSTLKLAIRTDRSPLDAGEHTRVWHWRHRAAIDML